MKLKHKCSICGKYQRFIGFEPITSFTNDEKHTRSEFVAARFNCDSCFRTEYIREDFLK